MQINSKNTKIIAVCNQKGGVGKTTTVVNLSAALALKGKKILIVDVDPQANATSAIVQGQSVKYNIYDIFLGKNIDNVILKCPYNKNIDIIASNIDLAGAEIELISLAEREFILKNILYKIKNSNIYDFIFIDCPPSISLLTVNAFAASDAVIIPIQCEYYALEGLGAIIDNISKIKHEINPALEVCGILLTMYDTRTRLSYDIKAEINKYFENLVFKTIIPRNIRIAEAPSYGKSVIDYDKLSIGSLNYIKAAEEFLLRINK